LHGNPTWSFLYRRWIRVLAPRHRCIAPDHLGFGRSTVPQDGSWHPQAHAARIIALVRHLDLRNLTLVMHDWGGPIGMACALACPERVERLVVMNTWGGPLTGDRRLVAFSRLLGSAFGQWAIERFNLFVRLMPLAFGTGSLSATARRHYRRPLDTPARRRGSAVFPRVLLGATDWLRALWARRGRLQACSALLLWGLRDPAFGRPYLRRWRRLFPNAPVHTFPEAGHYLPEEVGDAVPALMADFLAADGARGST
jgi:haloalkane dehalogenase